MEKYSFMIFHCLDILEPLETVQRLCQSHFPVQLEGVWWGVNRSPPHHSSPPHHISQIWLRMVSVGLPGSMTTPIIVKLCYLVTTMITQLRGNAPDRIWTGGGK